MERAPFVFRMLGVVVALGFVSGCASTPKFAGYSSRELMEAACPSVFPNETGSKHVTGSIWTKISSKEMSGQFPATVLVDYPKKLVIEVTNLIGAPQAWLKIEGETTELRFTAENERAYGKTRARTMLGGLPLALAPRLFAGGVPCPTDTKNKDIRIRAMEDAVEVIERDLRTRQQIRYRYSFVRYEGKPWVQAVEWEGALNLDERTARPSLIRIFREEPMDRDGAPKKWSASSAEGEIQIRWKDRTIGSL